MLANAEGIVIPDPTALIRLRHSARELNLFPRRQALSSQGGGYRSRFRGRGMEFDEVRPYQPGDDVRSIDWRVTARTNTTHTKIFREERERPVLIAVDLRSSMFFGSQRLKSMVACDIAALLAWAGINANDRVGGLVFSPAAQRDSRSHKSHHSVLRMIQHLGEACTELAQSQASGTADNLSLASILEECRRVATPGATLVIISDFHDLDGDCEKHLFELARHCDVSLCRIHDPLEEELPPPGLYGISVGADSQMLDSRDGKARERFGNLFRQRQSALAALGRRLALPVLEFA
ncbi:MAG: hypothetical protein VR73_14850, partial [Gammaproteobacteria bacterium BRH_c0]